MSKTRMINTRFWSDNFIREHLNPLDRYLFLYFLTNEKTNISGVYELPLSMIASETGIDREMLEKMMKRLEGKVDYHDGWVIVRNFLRYQNTDSPTIKRGIAKAMAEIPSKIKVFLEKGIPYAYPSHTVSIQPEESESKLESESQPKAGDEPEHISAKHFNDVYRVLEAFKGVNKHWHLLEGNKKQYDAADRMIKIHGSEKVLAIVAALPAINKMQYVTVATTPVQLELKWSEMEAQVGKQRVKIISNQKEILA